MDRADRACAWYLAGDVCLDGIVTRDGIPKIDTELTFDFVFGDEGQGSWTRICTRVSPEILRYMRRLLRVKTARELIDGPKCPLRR